MSGQNNLSIKHAVCGRLSQAVAVGIIGSVNVLSWDGLHALQQFINKVTYEECVVIVW